MEPKQRFYLSIAKVFPQRYKQYLKQLSIYAGEHIDVDSYLGSTMLIGLLVFAAILLSPFALSQKFGWQYFVFSAIAFALIQLAAYLKIYFKAEERTKRAEEVLPDVLQFLASNVRAGMTPYKALKLASKKEFGPLQEEMKYVTSRALGTESFSEILLEMSKRIKSEILQRALDLFTTAMRSGGYLATLLEELAEDITETQILKREMVTSTKTYVAFIMFTIVFGAPLLLAISVQFIDITTSMQENVGLSDVDFELGFFAGEAVITTDFLTKVAITMLVTTSILASMLLGTIQEGKPSYGLKYAPAIMTGTFLAFVVFRQIIANFFGNLM